MTEEKEKTDEELFQNFYDELAFEQVPLDPESEKILYENLWDLYLQ